MNWRSSHEAAGCPACSEHAGIILGPSPGHLMCEAGPSPEHVLARAQVILMHHHTLRQDSCGFTGGAGNGPRRQQSHSNGDKNNIMTDLVNMGSAEHRGDMLLTALHSRAPEPNSRAQGGGLHLSEPGSFLNHRGEWHTRPI